MKVELSAKLRNALQKQSRHTREHFDLGQTLIITMHNNDNTEQWQYIITIRSNDIKWKGPCKIVDQVGSEIFIRHGGSYVKVHCSTIQIADSLLDTIPQDNDSQLHFHH